MEQIYNNLGEVCPVRMLHDLQLVQRPLNTLNN